MRLAIAFAVLLIAAPSAAEVDTRAEVTVKLSPAECVLIHNRVASPGASVSSESESDSIARIGRVCDFPTLERETADAQKAKKRPDYSGPRTARKIARDTLDALVGYLVPTKERPVPIEQDGALRILRFEFREILAGRDPYR